MNRARIQECVLDLLFPPRCAFCQKILNSGSFGICSECQSKLPWITEREAEQKFEFVSLCVSPLLYQDDVREAIHRYKFYGRSGYAEIFSVLTAQCVADHLSGKFDVISWVPLSAKRLKRRGYDQAMLLAKATATKLNQTAIETLRKIRNTDAQSGIKDDSERRANVLGAYEIVDPEFVAGKRVLLVDDVVTTGATFSECARVLRTYGAKDVFCVSVARARGQKT